MVDIISRLAESIDPDHPTPAYHQLAAIIRWEIAEGRLAIGSQLPPIRAIAAAVDLNYHTIRRALGELEAEGVITLRRGRGGRVVRASRDPSGWSPAPSGGAGPSGGARVWVVAAALEQAARLAEQIAARWQVTAVPYPSGGPVPPPGPILVAGGGAPGAWGREGDLHATELVLDPSAVTVIRRGASLLATDRVVLVAHPPDAGPPLADLLRQLPRLGLSVHQADRPDLAGGSLNACLPAAYQDLDWGTRSDPRVMSVGFAWAPGPLARVARRLGWQEVTGDRGPGTA